MFLRKEEKKEGGAREMWLKIEKGLGEVRKRN
jgi:hypothetical protein